MQLKKYLLTGALLMASVAGAAQAAPANCKVRLSLQLTPDAASTDNPGFLTALVADPNYELRWIQGDDTAAVVDLYGPASDAQCAGGIYRLGRSSHVLEVKVIDPSSVETD